MSHPRVGSNSAQTVGRERRTKLGTIWATHSSHLVVFVSLIWSWGSEWEDVLCVSQETTEFGGNTTFTPGFERSFLILQMPSSRACSCISEMAILANTSGISVGPLACLRLMYINACSTSQN